MKSKTHIISLNLADPFGVAPYTRSKKQVVILTLDDGEEIYCGEGSPSKYYNESLKSVRGAFAKVKKLLVEEEFFFIEALMQKIFEKIPKDNTARAMIEMAIFDYIGKKLNIPLYKYLGLKPANDKQTSFTIGIDTMEIMLEKVERFKQFPILKIKLGRDAKHDIQVMKEIRKRMNRTLRVDANGGWTPEEAIRCIKLLADLGVEYVEQPLSRGCLKRLAELKKKSPLPIFVDEDVHRCDSFHELIGVCDGINLKLIKTGGILEMRRMLANARTFGLQTMLGCMIETSIAVTAAAHIASAFDHLDLDGNLLLADDPYEGMKVENGYLRMPERPGLGVRLKGK
ncbi:MAG TPA: dipeptide epimerase [Candidatus Sumerlaeota bacterium]|nr:dipeptide epimerase [Candidatus Sumerlaeota bacterium]HOR64625.1 dipeptide epimerase [Candidatus Sumerlaeota bacterium]